VNCVFAEVRLLASEASAAADRMRQKRQQSIVWLVLKQNGGKFESARSSSRGTATSLTLNGSGSLALGES
jgi:hypothetical protein